MIESIENAVKLAEDSSETAKLSDDEDTITKAGQRLYRDQLGRPEKRRRELNPDRDFTWKEMDNEGSSDDE